MSSTLLSINIIVWVTIVFSGLLKQLRNWPGLTIHFPIISLGWPFLIANLITSVLAFNISEVPRARRTADKDLPGVAIALISMVVSSNSFHWFLLPSYYHMQLLSVSGMYLLCTSPLTPPSLLFSFLLLPFSSWLPLAPPIGPSDTQPYRKLFLTPN